VGRFSDLAILERKKGRFADLAEPKGGRFADLAAGVDETGLEIADPQGLSIKPEQFTIPAQPVLDVSKSLLGGDFIETMRERNGNIPFPGKDAGYLTRLKRAAQRLNPQETTSDIASRVFLTAVDPVVDTALAVGRPVQYWNMKALQGLTLNAPDILMAAAHRINPKLTKGKTFEQATLSAAEYDPGGFTRGVGEIVEFIGMLRTGKAVGTKIGLLGGKQGLGILGRMEQAARLGLISEAGRESSKTIAEIIDPTTDYGSQGAVGPLKTATWLAGFSLANSLLFSPVMQKISATPTGQKIIGAADRYMVAISQRLPRIMDKIRSAPSQKAAEMLKQTGITRKIKDIKTGIIRQAKVPESSLTSKEKALLNHAARAIDTYHKRLYQAYMRHPAPDIVRRAEPAKIPAQITGAPPTIGKISPVAPSSGQTPARPTPIAKVPEIAAKGKVERLDADQIIKKVDENTITDEQATTFIRNRLNEAAQGEVEGKNIFAVSTLADAESIDPIIRRMAKAASNQMGRVQAGQELLTPEKLAAVSGIDAQEVRNFLEAKPTPAEGKLPPHLQIVADKVKEIDKQRGFTIEDVTPEGFGPSKASEPYPSTQLTTEQQRLINTINEAKTILKGDVAGDERAAIERSLAKAEKKLEAKPTPAEKPIEPSLLKKAVTVSDKKFHPVRLPTEAIGVDAERFQFKLGARLTGGVTEAMKEVEKYDPIKGGTILVWQDKSGKHWVIDGHHRVALARKTGQPEMDAWVVRETDGWSAAEARAVGALRNLADGKGTAIDAAKLFRDSGISLAELRKEGVPTNNTIVQQGMDMKKLSDEVFRLVIDDRLPANMAAAIGKNAKGSTQQKQVADLILEGEVDSVRQAELLSMTIDSAPVLTKSEQTLFGLETTEKSLYAERAKVLANVEKKLKTNKKVFGTLAKQSGLIEAKGNILAKVANLQAKELAEEVLYLLEKFANAKGEVAEALNEATKEYAKDPTRDNLSKVTNGLVQKWTQATTGLSVQNLKGLFGAPAKRAEPEIEGRSGFVDVRPLAKVHKSTMNILEPSKAVEIAQGKEAYATVIVGAHKADVGRIEFNEEEIENLDNSLQAFGEQLSKYSKATLTNLMAARGKPAGKGAILLKNEALKALAKEAPELVGVRKTITRIADFNYKYLQKVVGDDIKYVEDYFYGIYKDSKKVERFLDYWKTTKRFTKEKKLPTVADALDYGLELRDPNPVNNLRSEYMAIAHLDGMIYMRDELLRTGKGKYIDTKEEAPLEWEKVNEPIFKDYRVAPELALLINKLISTNQLRRHFLLNTLRKTNSYLRTVKFSFSAFHQLSIAKQSIADEGYLKFIRPSAMRGITLGFRKNDPAFKTQGYRDYIAHGGGHRYSIDSQAQRAFTQFVNKFNKSGRIAFKAAVLPLRIPERYVRWLFQNYIPKVKYAKYVDRVLEKEKELGRQLKSHEKIDIIKEQQNFYGMMNERLFGRGGTATSVLRLWFMAPGYAEGNYRTILKSILQWGGATGYKASRSRSNIINSLLLSAFAATVGTLALTGKPPKAPETREDVRDLFKIDTGRKDEKGRRIMIDLLTYDKDYWNVFGNIFAGQPIKAVKTAIKRTGGMVAPTAETIVDLASLAQGRAIYDWKGDRVTEVTDPFARQVLKIAIHEIKRTEPISVSVFKQSLRRDQTIVLSALTSLLGIRPTLSEKDKREQEVLRRIYSLKGQQEELYQYLGGLRNPQGAIKRYNHTVNSILDSKMVPEKMRVEWRPKLLIDIERLLSNKAYYLTSPSRTVEEIERAKKYLRNFGVSTEQADDYLTKYWSRERKKTPVSPLERDRVIGRVRKRKRLKERMETQP